MGKNEVIVPFMEFDKICNGQYKVGINLNGAGINITEVILDKINEGAQRRIVTCDDNILEYTSETLLPPPENIDNKKMKVLFVLGNPALHSIENEMFFFSKRDGVSRHGFWGKLAKNCLLENFELGTRNQEAKRRRDLILTGNTNHKFVIGFTTFYSMPTPTGITGNPYCDSKGVKKLFGSDLLKKVEGAEFARIITGIKSQPEVSAFAKDAILITTIIRARDYLCDKINDDRVKYWPISYEGSGWKDLREILNGI